MDKKIPSFGSAQGPKDGILVIEITLREQLHAELLFFDYYKFV